VAGPGQRVVGYIESWYHYSQQLDQWTDEVANKLTHVNYAFATISYSKTLDVYYVDMPDPWADSGDCMDATGCYQASPDCLKVPGEMCGDTVNLAPYIGAPSPGGSCIQGCVNNGGSPVSARVPPCNANLNQFTHPWKQNSSTQKVESTTVCGLYNRLLNPKNGVRAKWPHLRMMISIGGWYDSNFFSPATSDKYRASFIKSVVKFVAAFDWDGVDFDWEYPGFEHEGEPLPGMPKVGDPENCNNCNTTKCQYTERNQDGERYAKFLTEVKAALAVEQKARNRKDEYIISMAGPGGQDKLEKLDLVTMCKAFTYINVMTYDMHGSFDSITNHQSPMKCVPDAGKDYCYSVEGIIQAYLDGGCKAEQLHIGVPTYAHMYDKVAKGDGPLPGLYQNFSGPSESVCQKTPSECVPTYKKDGAMWAANKHWDNVSQASYAYDGSTFYSFDDVQSIGAKTAYLKEKGLGGFMYWFIGGDDASNTILTTMSNGLKNNATKL
jgi:GH18 family chitinase